MHLTEAELIEHLDGALPAERAAHLTACDRCRRLAGELAAALGEVRGIDAPDPSPLVLERLSAGVREAMDAQPESRFAFLRAAFQRPGLAFAGAAIALVVVFAALWPRVAPPPQSAAIAPAIDPAPAPDPIEADLEWTFVAAMAEGIDWDAVEAAGLSLAPGTAERAALQLSRDEQTELERLLRQEMEGDGSL
jgi:hypothetical protein